jgi:hypothetical protein
MHLNTLSDYLNLLSKNPAYIIAVQSLKLGSRIKQTYAKNYMPTNEIDL